MAIAMYYLHYNAHCNALQCCKWSLQCLNWVEIEQKHKKYRDYRSNNFMQKHCVGVLGYNEQKKALLIQSPKWVGPEGQYWIVPGGRIETIDGPLGSLKAEHAAAKREYGQELGVEITDLLRLGQKTKAAGVDFRDPSTSFLFVDYVARVLPGAIIPNHEVSNHGYFTLDETLGLYLLDSTRDFIQKVRVHPQARQYFK